MLPGGEPRGMRGRPEDWVLAVVFFAAACGSTSTDGTPTTNVAGSGGSGGGSAGGVGGAVGSGGLPAAECPARLIAQARALDKAILGFFDGTSEQRAALAEACSGIATDLGLRDLPAGSTDEDVSLLCGEASAALQSAVGGDASYAISPGSVSCTPNAEARQECDPTCELAGGSDQPCLDYCEAYATVTASCTGTPPAVSSVNAVLVAALEAHLSIVQAVVLWCTEVQPLGQELVDAATALRLEMDPTPGCSTWIPHLSAWLTVAQPAASVVVLLDVASEIDDAASGGG